jgi:hypothetical protein
MPINELSDAGVGGARTGAPPRPPLPPAAPPLADAPPADGRRVDALPAAAPFVVAPLADAPFAPAPRTDSYARLGVDRLGLPREFTTAGNAWSAFRFAAGQALLGVGGGRAAPIRAWYRRLVWAELRRRHGPLRAAAWVATQPVRVLREVRRLAARFGPACEQRFGVPVATQRRQMYWLSLVRGAHPDSYYTYQLHRPERRRQATLYLHPYEAARFYRILTARDARADFLLLEDKRRFELWCRAHALPSTRTLAEFAGGALVAGELAPDPLGALARARGRSLFSKPVDGSKGRGAHLWRAVGDRWLDADGTPRDADAMLRLLAEQSREDGMLLQECLANAPELRPLAPASGALCTVRLLTARPPGGAPEVINAGFRMGVGHSSTDNLSLGGVAAGIDVATGRLGPGVTTHPVLRMADVDRHPDTGAAIAGAQLPWWREAMALVVRAHAALPSIGFVGWDVALTPEGPVLVEGNVSPGARLSQALSGEPLGATRYLRHLDAHLRHTYARRR